jgi:dipeptidyl aminopeptidase/acylaminoacyl peptidase
VICPAWNAMGGTWGRDGTILFAADLGQTIYRVAAAGGDRVPLRTQGPHGFDLRWPSFLPDGTAFIYSARKTADAPRAIRVARLDGSVADRALLDSDSNAQVAGDRVLYVRQGILFAQPIDAATMELRGARVQVAERVPANLYNRADYANFSAASNGRLLAYLGTRQADRELRLIDRAGREQVLLGPGEYRDLAMARSGEKLAYEQLDEVSGTRDVWTLDLARRQATRITNSPDDEIAPVWSADERFIYYASHRDGGTGIYRRSADGTGDEVPVIVDANRAIPFDASPDGSLLSFTRPHQKRDSDLWLLQLTMPGKELAYRTSTWREGEPRFSPDGRWLVYSTTDTGDRHVYIERLDRPGPRWQVSERNGREPFWRGDGREIYYHGPHRTLMAVEVDLRGERPILGRPRPLFVLNFRDWDVRAHYVPLPDGRAFVANVPVAGSTPAPLTFVLDWTAR